MRIAQTVGRLEPHQHAPALTGAQRAWRFGHAPAHSRCVRVWRILQHPAIPAQVQQRGQHHRGTVQFGPLYRQAQTQASLVALGHGADHAADQYVAAFQRRGQSVGHKHGGPPATQAKRGHRHSTSRQPHAPTPSHLKTRPPLQPPPDRGDQHQQQVNVCLKQHWLLQLQRSAQQQPRHGGKKQAIPPRTGGGRWHMRGGGHGQHAIRVRTWFLWTGGSFASAPLAQLLLVSVCCGISPQFPAASSSPPERQAHVHSRRPEPRYPLQVRPPCQPRSPGHPAAPCTPLPQQCDLVFAQDRARQPFRELAARPVCQLPGTLGVPRENHRIQGHRGPGGGNGGLQPVRLLPRTRSPEVPVQLRRHAERGAVALPGHRAHDTTGAGLPRQNRPYGTPHQRLPGLHQPAGAKRHPVPDPYGAWRTNARRNPDQGQRLLPRLRLAAGATAAPPGPGGAFCVGLPDPADPRREGTRRPQRHHGGLHRPTRLV